MQLAQQLYEGLAIHGGEATGLITYMRTDSFRVSDQARDQARELYRGDAGQGILPGRPQRVQEQIQDPGRPRMHPPQRALPRPRRRQGRPESRPVQDLPAGLGEVLRLADGRRRDRGNAVRRQERRLPVRQQGRDREVQGLPGRAEERQRTDAVLPPLQEKEVLQLLQVDDKQNFTKPPPRYSEASLVKVLEEKGIGRPSTYAKIIETLNKREYVYNEEKKFVPTDLGINVVDYLEENFSDIMNYNFHRRAGKGARPGRRGQARLGGRHRPVLQEAGPRPGEGQGRQEGGDCSPAASAPTAAATW